MANDMKYCRKCGTQVPRSTRFCTNCGCQFVMGPQGPDTQSSDAQRPDTQSPNTQSSQPQGLNTQRPNAQTPNPQRTNTQGPNTQRPRVVVPEQFAQRNAAMAQHYTAPPVKKGKGGWAVLIVAALVICLLVTGFVKPGFFLKRTGDNLSLIHI